MYAGGTNDGRYAQHGDSPPGSEGSPAGDYTDPVIVIEDRYGDGVRRSPKSTEKESARSTIAAGPQSATARQPATMKWLIALAGAAALACIIAIYLTGSRAPAPSSPEEKEWVRTWVSSSSEFRAAQCDMWDSNPERYLQIGVTSIGHPADLVRRMMDNAC